MALRLPVVWELAEYRGVDPNSGEFVNSEGEQVKFGPKCKFEIELPNGDVTLLPVSSAALDRLEPAVDYKTLKRGERVELAAVIQFNGNEPRGEAFVRVVGLQRHNGAKPAGQS